MTHDNISFDKFIDDMQSGLDNIHGIYPDMIPNVDIYMDQLTTFMDKALKSSARSVEDGKILTKTMINNYAKNKILPPPEKKKYSRDHIIILIFIYYLKSIYSISDIKILLRPIYERFGMDADAGNNLMDIYEKLMVHSHDAKKGISDDIKKYEGIIRNMFSEENEASDTELLKCFGLVTLLSYDSYIKSRLVERFIDELGDHYESIDKSAKEKAKKTKRKKK